MSSSMLRNFRLGNAAGTAKTLADVEKLCLSAVDTITVGSVTVNELPGNPGTNHYQFADGGSVNSLGLKNPGLDYYQEQLPAMLDAAKQAGKKLSVSIAPLELDDAERLATICLAAGRIDYLELNVGCPNVWEESGQKKIPSFDLPYLETACDTLLRLRTRKRYTVGLRIKLSPYSDPGQLAEVAQLIGSFGTPKARIAIVSANTFPNALGFVPGDRLRYAIPFGEHLGGYSGTPYRAIALGQIAQFRKALPKHPLIGVGGIAQGSHIQEYMLAGANEVQIGSAYYYSENARIFSDLQEELYYAPPQHHLNT